MTSNETHHRTELGNAKRLVQYHGDKLRYVRGWGWLVWNGKYWEVSDERAERAAKDIPARIYSECAELPDGDARKALAKWAIDSESAARIAACLKLAKNEQEILAQVEDFDRDPWLLNLENGTLDLKTGKLLPHNPANMITKIAGVSYNSEADCPHWLKFLTEIMRGKKSLITYIQRAVGYSLTGSTQEQCFFLLYGTGNNGKSTLLETIAALLGGYGEATDFTTFLAKDSDAPRNDLAGLAGARFVMAKESERGQRLAESLLKSLTGQDTIKARFLFKELFSFKPSFKVFLATNHKPMIRGADLGIWRRVKLIPFEFSVAPGNVDKTLPEKLQTELPGILNWAIEGCLDWHRDGLAEPDEVTLATTSYKTEQDTIVDFIAWECTTKPVKGKKQAQTLVKTVYKAYEKWFFENNSKRDKPLSNRSFSSALKERGYIVEPGTANQLYIKNLRVLSEIERTERDAKAEAEEAEPNLFNRMNSENSECIDDISAGGFDGFEQLPDL